MIGRRESAAPAASQTHRPPWPAAFLFAGLMGVMLGPVRNVARADRSQAGSDEPVQSAADQPAVPVAGPAWTDSQCQRCHAFDPMLSHPLNVVPSMAVPEHLPLEAGRLTCTTCHDVSDPIRHRQARQRQDPLLRSPGRDPLFCLQCHFRPPGRTRRQAHPGMVGRAHLEISRAEATGNGRMPRLDEESRLCLSCHDGTMASDVGIGLSSRFGDPGRNHPIGVPYATRPSHAKRLAGQTNLTPAASLDRRIRLFDGTVGCGSCHSHYSQMPALLVKDNSASQLCLSCHRL